LQGFNRNIKESTNTAKRDKLHNNLTKPSYSVPEVAKLIGITPYRVQMMIKLGQIDALLAGRQKIILRADLDNYFKNKNTSLNL
tara:strand:- start:389 stop:640 length:252 start_codon:yes stop_codon:yes gene_type:complete